jgi:hydroxymethylpyrimidine/phosphomethylpyrimidine kinase
VDLLTPNLPEASFLCGFPVEDETDWTRAARTLHDLGARAVLIKGGHGKGPDAKDLLFDGKEVHTFSAPRVATRNTHGTGCVYSAALATFMAQGLGLMEAVSSAKAFVTDAIRFALSIGQGHGPTNPYSVAFRDAERYRVLTALGEVAQRCTQHPHFLSLAPEVQFDLGYALPQATTADEVASLPGLFVRLPEGLTPVRCPAFGASQHIAHTILAAMHTVPELRSAMNIQYSESILDSARRKGLKIVRFDRSQEPQEIKAKEGSASEWGITQAVQSSTEPPDLICDQGDVDKEPMICILGKDPHDVMNKILLLL